jgi:nickel/cobalt exporter
MIDALIYLASAFWIGAVHAATPGHGKTIAAAYIVGARGKPVDAVILGIFVTLSHTSGIVLVGILASIGMPGMVPQRIEAWLALITGLLVIVIGLWTLWTQRELIMLLQGVPRTPSSGHSHTHGLPEQLQDHHANRGQAPMQFRPHTHSQQHVPGHAHHHGQHSHGMAAHTHAPHTVDHQHDEEAGYHSHGWGFKHTHDMKLATTNRPGLWILIGLGVAGGLLPDPAALAILLNALAQGKVMLGLGTVVVFSVGFAATLVVVGVVASKVGQRILDWLAGPWAMRLQVGTSLLIVVVGTILSFSAWRTLTTLT